MLDEREFALIEDARKTGVLQVKRARSLEGRPLKKSDREILYGGVAALYRKMTGVSDIDPREILRHRLSLVGPSCEKCGRERRTPRAKKCPQCG